MSALWSARESADVTNWPGRLALTGITLGLAAAVCWLMWRGWKARGGRQRLIPAPVSPQAGGQAPTAVSEVRYLGSTTAGDWLDRIVVHRLGEPSLATLSIGPTGVALHRLGAPDLLIPSTALLSARTDRGQAGAVFGDAGLLVVTWRLGTYELDTGVRARTTEDHPRLADLINELASSHKESL